MPNADASIDRQLLETAKHDLACYILALFPEWVVGSHIYKLIDHLEAVERGEIKRLMVYMPPRHSKSLTSTQFFPAWYLGRNPNKKVVSASYGQELADDFGRKVRDNMNSEVHRYLFPEGSLRTDSQAVNRLNTIRGGSYYAVGVGGALTGRGGDLLLIDDPIKDYQEAQSETIRKRLQDWYRSVLYTRKQPNAAIILIQTRWHEDDLAGWLLNPEKNKVEDWTIVSMPAIAEETMPEFPPNVKVVPDEREPGEALWPEWFPPDELDNIKTALGSHIFTALYQQRPTPLEGGIFKRAWMNKRFRMLPAECGTLFFHSWDTAYSEDERADYSVGTVWAVSKVGYYIVDRFKAQVELPELKQAAKDLAQKWRPKAVFIEAKASGKSLAQELRRDTRLPIIEVKVDKDKVVRASAVSPLFESGLVYFPEEAPWVHDLIEELCAFPNGAHDDQVDSVSQALNRLAHYNPLDIPAQNAVKPSFLPIFQR